MITKKVKNLLHIEIRKEHTFIKKVEYGLLKII